MSVVDDVVVAYIRRLEELGLSDLADSIFPSADVFREIEAMSGAPAEAVVERLAEAVSEKIRPDVAEEVVGAPAGVAVWLLARRIAMWYLQLALELGVVRER